MALKQIYTPLSLAESVSLYLRRLLHLLSLTKSPRVIFDDDHDWHTFRVEILSSLGALNGLVSQVNNADELTIAGIKFQRRLRARPTPVAIQLQSGDWVELDGNGTALVKAIKFSDKTTWDSGTGWDRT